MGSINHLQAIRPDTAYLKKIIENSLLADWAISIEYQSSEAFGWQLWNTAYFAIRSAKPVLEALLDCYTKYPTSTIRICAEKFHPQTRLLYTAYNPQYQPAETIPKPESHHSQSSLEYSRASDHTRIVA